MQNTDVVIIGAGQAGLSTSYELTKRNVDHVILERGKIGESWRRRWNSFCLVTPNWSMQLPGCCYDDDDPDGFLPRDQIVEFLEDYARSFGAPVQENVAIRNVSGGAGQDFDIETDQGHWRSKSLIIATGAFQKPIHPAGADQLPAHLAKLDLSDFTCNADLPSGGILIIGSGQSGCQIAEELRQEGRDVVLACGRAPWAPRRIAGKDLFWWLSESGFMDALATELPQEARLFANVLATGHGGGHDLNLRLLREQGITLAGRFLGCHGNKAQFADDLQQSVEWGDQRYLQLRDVILTFAAEQGMPPPDMPVPGPFLGASPTSIDLTDFGSVLFTGGFRPDYQSWLPWAEAFDEGGFPVQTDGKCDAVERLYFVGQHFLRKRKSALLYGVGEDATIVAEMIKPQPT